MTIMVDELRVFPGARRPFHRGSCHLTTDQTLEHLHAFALRIGLKLEWFQDHRIAPHYDLTPRRRELALKLGAIFVPIRQQILARRQGAA